MIPAVEQLRKMDAQTWSMLSANLRGITEEELDWRPHPEGNPIRWILGHLAWFDDWIVAALKGEGRYLTDTAPGALTAADWPSLQQTCEAAWTGFRAATAELSANDLARRIRFVGRYDLTVLSLLETHTLHLAGHRYQVRYLRGCHSRAMGTSKLAFDPW